MDDWPGLLSRPGFTERPGTLEAALLREAIPGRLGTEWVRRCPGAKPLGQEPLDAPNGVKAVGAAAIPPESARDYVHRAIP
jgi:hypothetical protein